ncbi:hypothetical protein GCM10010320_54990 [Streptomyces caelestis]|nr:hypothetical protein GCM10010320_54990 [Streptomyces caelestis]
MDRRTDNRDQHPVHGLPGKGFPACPARVSHGCRGDRSPRLGGGRDPVGGLPQAGLSEVFRPIPSRSHPGPVPAPGRLPCAEITARGRAGAGPPARHAVTTAHRPRPLPPLALRVRPRELHQGPARLHTVAGLARKNAV